MTEWLSVVLTACVVVAAGAQAWFIRQQRDILKSSAELAQERNCAKVKFVFIDAESARGFMITNAGAPDIEIVSFYFEVGWLPSDGDEDPPTTEISFPIHEEGEDPALPRRLQHAESVRLLFSARQLVQESAKLGGENPVHLRPVCTDTLHNKHKGPWVQYRSLNSTAFADRPSPGRITEEERNALSRNKRHRYTRATHRRVTRLD